MIRGVDAERARLGLAVLAGSAMAAPACAAQWQLQPAAQAYAVTETDPRLQAGAERSAQAGGADLAVTLARHAETLDLAAEARAELRRYTQNVNLDRDEEHLNFSLIHLGEEVTWAGKAALARDTTLTSELGTTGLSQVNLRHEAIDLSLGPTWQLTERASAGGTLYWDESRYPDAAQLGLVSNRYSSAALTAGYAITEKTSVSLMASSGELRADAINFRSRTDSLVLQAQYRWSPLWTFLAYAGPSRVVSRQASQNGTRYDLEITRQQSERTVVSLSASRSVAPTGRGFLTQQDNVSVRLGRALGERLDASFAYAYIHSRDVIPAFGFALNDVRYSRAEAAFTWRLAEQWSTTASVARSDQHIRALDATANNLEARLAIAWTGKPLVL